MSTKRWAQSNNQQTLSPSDLEWLALPLHSQSIVKKGAVLTVNLKACKHQPAEAKPSSSHPSEGSFPALLHPTPPKHDKAPEPPRERPRDSDRHPKERPRDSDRHRSAETKRSPTQRHQPRISAKHLSTPPVIEPSVPAVPWCLPAPTQNAPSTPRSHGFGIPPQVSRRKGSPQDLPVKRPAVKPIQREHDRPTQNRRPHIHRAPDLPHIHPAPHHTPNLASRINDLSTYQFANWAKASLIL